MAVTFTNTSSAALGLWDTAGDYRIAGAMGGSVTLFPTMQSASIIRIYEALGKGSSVETDAPDAFVLANWSAAGGVGALTVTISALPDADGISLTGIAIRLNETDVTIVAAALGDYEIADLVAGNYDIDIAAISDAGQSAWSDVKTVTVT